MSKILYFIKEAFVNFKRNWSTSLGAIVTIFLSLFVIGLFLIGALVINNVIQSIENKVTIQVFIADDASQSDIDKLSSTIKGMDYVSTVGFTTKEQALTDFQDSMTSNPEIIDQLDGTNPLPASIDVDLTDPQEVENVAQAILADTTFQTICDEPEAPTKSLKYGQQTIDRFFQVVNYIRAAGIAVVALLIFVTFIFINNTIRLAILARRKEIAIMRLVGASNGFIRGPFITEAALQAVIGAILAIICCEVIHRVAMPRLAESFSWLPVELAGGMYFQIYLILFIAGLVIGLFGSALAMRRYLKV